MNSSTRLRLAKEVRALLPFWAASAAWVIVPFLLPVNDPLGWSLAGYLFGCVVLGAIGVSHEFAHGTIGALLAQPVPRSQLWREKLWVTAAALLSISLLLMALIQATTGWGEFLGRGTDADSTRAALFAAIWLLIPVMCLCTGPTFTLISRNALGGSAMTFMCPYLLMLLGVLIAALLGLEELRFGEQVLQLYALVVGTLYSGVLFWVGGRCFNRLEDAAPIRRELALPAQFSPALARLAALLLPGGRGVTATLLRKELRLQQPAFLVAAFFVVFWLACSVVRHFHPPMQSGLLMVSVILLCLGVPVTVGIVSTAEERSWGLHDWHLTLPVSAGRQWFVKVSVALTVNFALGLLLPGLLANASSWLANDPHLIDPMSGNVPPILIANFVLLAAALYASAASANGLRALIGSIVLFAAAGLFLPMSVYVGQWLTSLVHQVGPNPPNAAYHFLYRLRPCYWLLGWVVLAAWLYSLGRENFSSSLASLNRPVRGLALFFIVTWLFVNIGWYWPTLLVLCFQRFGW